MPDEVDEDEEHKESNRPGRVERRRETTRRNRRAWIIAFVSTVVLLAAAGLTLALTAGRQSPGPPSSSSTTSAGPGPPCPLSGLASSGKVVPQRPALAVKVDNYPTARPQSGLDKADIVFEEPVEGGITRLVAVFQCQTASLVGPIRSARAVDASILDQLSKPIFVHVGGIAPVLSLITEADLYDEDISAEGGIAQNPPGRYPPYDTYVSTQSAWRQRPGDTTPPRPIFTYSSSPPAGTPVTSIHIPYSQTNDVMWSWSAGNGRWMLSYGGTPATVASGGQIGVSNVVVQKVRVTYGPWAENSQGALEVQSQLTGSGPLTVFRNGVAVNGTWQRSSLESPTRLVASNGRAIALEPGETWVEIVPDFITVSTASPASGSRK